MSGAGNFGERQKSDARDWGLFAHLSIYDFASRFVAGKRCLEIGCGTGYGTEHLLQADPLSMVALDKEESAVATLRRKGVGAEFFARDLDLEGLGLADREFDFVFSSNVFEHLAYPDDLLAQITAVLTTDGAALIAVPPICTPGMLSANAQNIFHINNIPPWAWRSKLSRYFHSVKCVRHWVSANRIDHLGQIKREDAGIDDFVFTEEPALGFETITSIFLAHKPREKPLPPDELAESCPAWWRAKKIEADARQWRLTELLQNLDEARRWAASNRAKGVDPNFILDGIQRHLLLLTGGDESTSVEIEDPEYYETRKTTPVRRTLAYPSIDDSVLGCIVTGFAKGGTTLVKDLLLHTTDMFGCFEGGFLLSETPFEDMRQPFKDTLIKSWGLASDFSARYRACPTFEDGYRLLRRESPKVKRKEAPLIDKLHEYLPNLGSVMRRAPGTPVVVVLRDLVQVSLSWLQWNNDLPSTMYWLSSATESLLSVLRDQSRVSPIYMIRLEHLVANADAELAALQIWLGRLPEPPPTGIKLGLPRAPSQRELFPRQRGIEIDRHDLKARSNASDLATVRRALEESVPGADVLAKIDSGPVHLHGRI